MFEVFISYTLVLIIFLVYVEHHSLGRRFVAIFYLLILLCYFPWQLSMWRCNDELRFRADGLLQSSKKDAKHYIGN